MAEAGPIFVQSSPETETPLDHAPKLSYVKTLVESADLRFLPSNYTYNTDPIETSEPEDTIPVIDFSLLTSGDLAQRTKIIQDLGKACQEWGFFMVVNHGVPENIMKMLIDKCNEFFNLTQDEKREFGGKHVLDPIRIGTSFNPTVEKVSLWRDFLKVFVHPKFHFPNKPKGFSEVAHDYCERTREVARELLRGISESLGLEGCYIEKALNLESGLQVLVGNLYPPCPQPELAMGLPPHSDYGLLTLLIQNVTIRGLQLKHKGKWVDVNALPNSFLVNTGDHLEILSNGKYKSGLHRAVVNGKTTRISIGTSHGPPLDTIVGPAQELIDRENHSPSYIPLRYKEYLELQQISPLDGKSCLDRVRVHRA